MKKLLYNLLFLLVLICFHSVSANAQHFVELAPPDSVDDFHAVVNAVNQYWVGKDYTEKGKGWKPFKRWEWFWQSRLTPEGKLPNQQQYFNTMKQYRSSAALGKTNKNKTQAASWSSIGPSSSAGGYAGLGRLNCVAVHPTNSNIIWAGAASGGLWKTTNGGASWATTTDELSSIGISDIAVVPTSPYNTIYIATGDRDAGDTYSVGVLKSTDGGATWAATGFTVGAGNYYVIGRLLIDPSNTSVILAATNGGIYRTSNGGANWTQVQSGSFKDMEFKPGNTNVMYATGTKVYKSTNNGQTWTQCTVGLPASGVYRYAVAVCPDSAAKVYVLGARSSDYGLYGVYISNDDATSFTEVKDYSTPNLLGWKGDGTDAGGQGFYDLCIAVSPTNKDLVFVGGINIWKSTNCGVSWSPCAIWTNHPTYNPGGVYPVVHADHHDLFFNSGSLYSCHDGGIDVTSNLGSSWTYIGSGIRNTQFYKFGTYRSNDALIIGGCQDVGTKLKSGSSWTDVIGGDGMECIIAHSDPNLMWGSLYYGDLRKSTDGGTSFIQKVNGITENGNWVTPFAMHPTDANILYAGYVNIFKTTNGGTSWSKLTAFSSSSKFSILKIAKADPNYVIAAYTTGSSNTVKYTTNGGTGWSTMTVPSGYLADIEFDPSDVNTLYICYSGYNAPGAKVYYSTNFGANWTNISGSLPDVPVNCLYRDPDNSTKRLYIGTDIGVWYCDNNTGSWTDFNDGLPNVVVTELYLNDLAGKLQAATYGRGIWETAVTTAPKKVTLSSPATNSVYQNVDNLTLSWEEADGALSYRLQVSANSNMSSPVVDQSGISGTSKQVSDLSNYQKYYWRVLASGSETYDWSDIWNFTTKVGIPSLTTPADNATGVSVSSGQLTWAAVTGASTYHIKISNNSDMLPAHIVFENESLSGAAFNLSNATLDNNTVYYWNVHANSSDGPGESSEIWSFKTNLSAPALFAPDNNASGLPVSGTVKWRALEGAISYKLVVSANSNLSSPVVNETALTDTSYEYQNFSSNTKYYWRVTATNSEGTGEPSQTWNFTTFIGVPTLFKPDDLANYAAVSGNVSWHKVSGATSYNMQIAADSLFSQVLAEVTGETDTTTEYEGLNYDTRYYWHVLARNTAGETEWSTVWRFNTIFAPPELVSPENDTTNALLSGRLLFKRITAALKYRIQLSTYSDFSANLIYDKDISTNYLDYSDLEHNKTYYWRVLAYSSTGTATGWTEPWKFSTIGEAGVPELVSPANNSTEQPVNLTLEWKEVTGAVKYDVQVSKSSQFSTIEKDVAGVTGTSTDVTGLQKETTYYWRVKAFVNGEYSQWSVVWSFTTAGDQIVVGKPVLLSPANNAVSVKVSGNLLWKKAENAVDYIVQLSRSATFSTTIIDAAVTDTLKAFSGLQRKTKHFWRVKGKAGAIEGPWSDTWNFTTEDTFKVVDKIKLNFPPNNKDKVSKNTRLVWNSAPGAVSYTLEIAKQKNFAVVDKTIPGITDTFYVYNGLKDGGRYYWRVKAVYEQAESGWSDIWSFLTESGLVAPALVSPQNNANDVAQDLILNWSAVEGADNYNLQVSKDPSFDDYSGEANPVIIDAESIAELNYQYKFDRKTQYYWRVNQNTDGVQSAWSEAWAFTTDDVYGVRDDNSVEYFTCNPNPTGGEAVIAFSVKGERMISIAIYNSLGQELLKPIDNTMLNGNHSLKVALDGYTPGIYIIKLTSGNDVRSIKLVLVK